MKRVTLLAHDVGEPNESTGTRPTVLATVDGDRLYLALPVDIFEAVEDVREPLPTTPGERFWGRSELVPREQWWFVQGTPGYPGTGPSYVVYVPALDGWKLNQDCCLNATLADREGLVRLPDPEPQP